MVKFATNSVHVRPNIVFFRLFMYLEKKKCLGMVLAVSDFYNFNGTVSTVPNSLCRDTVDKIPKHPYFD